MVTLDVEIETNSDSEIGASDPNRPFAALAMAPRHQARWRNLTIRSFPNEIDLIEFRGSRDWAYISRL